MAPTTVNLNNEGGESSPAILHIAAHGLCRNEGLVTARAATGISFYEVEWSDLDVGELVGARMEQGVVEAAYLAIARALLLAPKEHELHIYSSSEFVANTLNLALKERADNNEATTKHPKSFDPSNLDKYSHAPLIKRIMYAVQTREREGCDVCFGHYEGKGVRGFFKEAKGLALAALADAEDVEEERQTKKRKLWQQQQREETTLSSASSSSQEEDDEDEEA